MIFRRLLFSRGGVFSGKRNFCTDFFVHSLTQINLYVLVYGLQVVRPFNEPYLVFPAQSSLLLVQLLPGKKCLFSAEKLHRMKMLDSLIFNCSTERRNIEIEALAA